jgi:hypothetical protein
MLVILPDSYELYISRRGVLYKTFTNAWRVFC